MADIFISYRREDTQHAAGRLCAALREHFGNERVFMDTRAIAPGECFPQVIENELRRCHVFLPLLGGQWLSLLRQRQGDLSADYVRREIAAALQHGLHIIPLRIDAARVPSAGDLPEDIRGFAAHNGLALRHDIWDADCAALIAAIDRHLAALSGDDADPLWLD